MWAREAPECCQLWGEIYGVSECRRYWMVESMLKRFQMGMRSLLGTGLQGVCTARGRAGGVDNLSQCHALHMFAGLQFCVGPIFPCHTPVLSFGVEWLLYANIYIYIYHS